MGAGRDGNRRRTRGPGGPDHHPLRSGWTGGTPSLGRGTGAGDGRGRSSTLPRIHPSRTDRDRSPLRFTGGGLRDLRRQLAGSGRGRIRRERSTALAGESCRLSSGGRRDLSTGRDPGQSLGPARCSSNSTDPTRGSATGTLADGLLGRGPFIGCAGSPGAGRRSDRRAGRCRSSFVRTASPSGPRRQYS